MSDMRRRSRIRSHFCAKAHPPMHLQTSDHLNDGCPLATEATQLQPIDSRSCNQAVSGIRREVRPGFSHERMEDVVIEKMVRVMRHRMLN